MKPQSFLVILLMSWLVMAGCVSQTPAPNPATESTEITARSANETGNASATQTTRYNGPGHDYATAVQFSGVNNPLAFSQKQQEWLWLHYRDWKKLGQALREKNGVRYDEVTLQSKQGEKRVIYFRMPSGVK